MCGGGGPDVDTSFQDWSMREAERARFREKQRQRRIDQGMDRIAAVFEGGRLPGAPGKPAGGKFDPNAKYFTKEDGEFKRWRPPGAVVEARADPGDTDSTLYTMEGGQRYRLNDGEEWQVQRLGQWEPAGKPPELEAPSQRDLFRGFTKEFDPRGGVTGRRETDNFNIFKTKDGVFGQRKDDPNHWVQLPGGGKDWVPLDEAPELGATVKRALEGPGKLYTTRKGKKTKGMDPILEAREKAQRQFYLPQLRENNEEAQDALTFALSRAGLTTSTTALEKAGKLKQGFRKERAGVLADIEADVANTKSAMLDNRAAIESQLRASGDASAAAQAALDSRSVFAQDMPELSPLANTLLAFTENIGQAKQGFDVGRIARIARGGTVNRDQSRIVS